MPGNCWYCVLYKRFSASQFTVVSRKKINVQSIYLNELRYVDNPENGWKLLLPKHWQPLANVNGVISCKPVISSAPLWEYQSCTSNYKTCCISASSNSVRCITTHSFPHFLRCFPALEPYTQCRRLHGPWPGCHTPSRHDTTIALDDRVGDLLKRHQSKDTSSISGFLVFLFLSQRDCS